MIYIEFFIFLFFCFQSHQIFVKIHHTGLGPDGSLWSETVDYSCVQIQGLLLLKDPVYTVYIGWVFCRPQRQEVSGYELGWSSLQLCYCSRILSPNKYDNTKQKQWRLKIDWNQQNNKGDIMYFSGTNFISIPQVTMLPSIVMKRLSISKIYLIPL